MYQACEKTEEADSSHAPRAHVLALTFRPLRSGVASPSPRTTSLWYRAAAALGLVSAPLTIPRENDRSVSISGNIFCNGLSQHLSQHFRPQAVFSDGVLELYVLVEKSRRAIRTEVSCCGFKLYGRVCAPIETEASNKCLRAARRENEDRRGRTSSLISTFAGGLGGRYPVSVLTLPRDRARSDVF